MLVRSTAPAIIPVDSLPRSPRSGQQRLATMQVVGHTAEHIARPEPGQLLAARVIKETLRLLRQEPRGPAASAQRYQAWQDVTRPESLSFWIWELGVSDDAAGQIDAALMSAARAIAAWIGEYIACIQAGHMSKAAAQSRGMKRAWSRRAASAAIGQPLQAETQPDEESAEALLHEKEETI